MSLKVEKRIFLKIIIVIGFSALGGLISLPKPSAAINQSREPSIFKALDIQALPKFNELTQARVSELYGNFPLSFEKNCGQTDDQVRYLAHGNRYSLFLTQIEAVLELQKSDPQAKTEQIKFDPDNPVKKKLQTSTIRMKLAGANPLSNIEVVDELPGKSNYFIGNDSNSWRTNILHYKRVKYEDVYPGIDLIYYGNQQALEYDLMVSPGSDPRDIAISFQGADKIEIDPEGDLVLHTESGELRQRKPVVYQEDNGNKRMIAGRYVLKSSDMIGFQIDSYDPRKLLVIDPVLVYSTYLGSNGSDLGFSIATDSSRNVYVTGRTTSMNFPTVKASQAEFGGGDGDVFVTKLSASGRNLAYSTYIGGRSADLGTGIAVDATGNAYVTGQTSSINFPTANPFQSGCGSGCSSDAFVLKLNSEGNGLTYSTFLGGDGVDFAISIAVDSIGNAYVTGFANSQFPTTPGAFQTSGSSDAFVTKLNSTGRTLAYSTYLGGRNFDRGNGIAVDSTGNAYIVGITNSPNFPTTTSSLQTVYGGGSGQNPAGDAFVTKLNESGSALVYSTYLGGSEDDEGNRVAVDFEGNAYLIGDTDSLNFPLANPEQPVFRGIRDAFAAKLNAAGNRLIYSTYLGGSGEEEGNSIAVDSVGNAYATGRTNSADFPLSNPLQAVTAFGPGDAFITKLNKDGSSLIYSTFFGGNGTDSGNAIAVDSAGNAYITGSSSSTDFQLLNPLQIIYGGGQFDAFIIKISDVDSQDFMLNISPREQTVTQGTSASFKIDVRALGSLNQGVTLSALITPSDPNIAVDVSPNIIQPGGAAVLTVRTSINAAAPVGSYAINVTGASGNLVRAAQAQLTITGNFRLTLEPNSQAVEQADTAVYKINVLGNFNQPIDLRVAFNPFIPSAPIMSSISPNPASAGSTATLTLTPSITTPPGFFSITLTGNSGRIAEFASARLTVMRRSSVLDMRPELLNLKQGETAQITAQISSNSGFNGNLKIKPQNIKNIGGKITPKSVSVRGESANFIIKLSKTAAVGQYQLVFTVQDEMGRTEKGTLTLSIGLGQ